MQTKKTNLQCVPTFKVFPDKGLVVCRLVCNRQLDKLQNYNTLKYMFPNLTQWEQFVTKGIAKLHPDDTFNEELGKKIALSKATIKALKNNILYYDKMVKPLLASFSEISNIITTNYHTLSKENIHLKNLKD